MCTPVRVAATLSLLLAAAAFAAEPAEKQEKKPDPAKQAPAEVPKLSVEEFDALRKAENTVVVDVRTPAEFKAGHVPGAVNIDVADKDFDKKVEALDKGKTYVVHCARGGRSAQAAGRMKSKVDKLFDFSGGMTAWEKAGKPVEK